MSELKSTSCFVVIAAYMYCIVDLCCVVVSAVLTLRYNGFGLARTSVWHGRSGDPEMHSVVHSMELNLCTQGGEGSETA